MRMPNNQMSDKEIDDLIDRLVKINAASFEAASKYTVLIMAAGYAGLLSLISSIKDKSSPKIIAWSVIFVGISLVIFVLWEIYKMVTTADFNARLSRVIHSPRHEFSELYNTQVRYENEVKVSLAKLWPWVICSTLGTGLVAFVLLMWASFVIAVK